MSEKTEGVGRLNVATPGRRETRREPTPAEHEAEIDAANSVGKRNGEWVILTAEEQDMLRDGPDRRLSEPQPSRQDPKALMEFLLGRIAKHATHDQKTHGNWAHGSVSWDEVLASPLDRGIQAGEPYARGMFGDEIPEHHSPGELLALMDMSGSNPSKTRYNRSKLVELYGDEGKALIYGVDRWQGNMTKMEALREDMERGEPKATAFLDAVRRNSMEVPAPLYRGMNIDVSGIEVGDTLTHRSISSFSSNRDHLMIPDKRVVLVMRQGEALNVSGIGSIPEEREYLVGLPMKVVGTSVEHGQFVIEVETVRDGDGDGKVFDGTDKERAA